MIGLEERERWEKIAAPIPAAAVQWRQQGKAKLRDGKYVAPFVAYIDAQLVRDRLDTVVPGDWNLKLEMLPPLTSIGGDGETNDEPVSFKAQLQISGVIREDVGAGRDYKTASTDAFKRAAVRFGVGHELYTDYEIVWVEVDGDGKYAKPLQDPANVWAYKQGKASAPASAPASNGSTPSAPKASAPSAHPGDDEPSCPKCGGKMWDNRASKKNPKAPDHKCRSRSCDGVIWPAKKTTAADEAPDFDSPPDYDDRSLPF